MLKERLRPEFLNRIDEKIMFLPLTKEEIKLIAHILLRKVKKNLKRQHIEIEFSDSAMDLLADLGYEPQFGARPLKRVIQRELINELSKEVLAGNFSAGDTIHVGTDAKGFTFTETETGSTEKPEVEKKETKRKKDKQIDELKKATEDLEDEIKKHKKGNGKPEDN